LNSLKKKKTEYFKIEPITFWWI